MLLDTQFPFRMAMHLFIDIFVSLNSLNHKKMMEPNPLSQVRNTSLGDLQRLAPDNASDDLYIFGGCVCGREVLTAVERDQL